MADSIQISANNMSNVDKLSAIEAVKQAAKPQKAQVRWQVADNFEPAVAMIAGVLPSGAADRRVVPVQSSTGRRQLGGRFAFLLLILAPVTTLAQEAPVAPVPAANVLPLAPSSSASDPPSADWINGIHLSGQIEGGISANPSTPKQNVGQLFTDHPNQPLLNQMLVTASKPLDPKTVDFDWGFKLQLMYGSDARYTHFLGELDQVVPGDRNQLDVVEAHALFHLPFFTEGGMDVKAGQYSTPLGFETIDPSTNAFYSHSYIFNFGLPFKHTGVLTTTHVTPLLDVYLSVDTGVNTTFGPSGDNNSAIAFLGGLGLNMMEGRLSVLALTHIGPENATRAFSPAGYNADEFYRYLNDVIVTYKATDKLTLVTEANLVREDAGSDGGPGGFKPANAFGIAQYASYNWSDTVTVNGRVEVFRDDNKFFVFGTSVNDGFDNAQKGVPSPLITALHLTTYSEITLGVSYKPANMPPYISGLLLRPEVRYDRALTGTRPFNDGKANGAVTFATDFVLSF